MPRDLCQSVAIATVAILCVCSAALASEPREDGAYSVSDGLAFTQEDASLTLDLFVPVKTEGAVPCVIVIQGGGFMPQNGQRFRSFAVYLAEHDYAAALISYRGRPDHGYRDTIADTKAAVRFVRRVAGDYDIDPNRVGAMGRSAGGTLAALLAVTAGEKSLEGRGGSTAYSSRIQAAVAYAGVFDFISRFTDSKQLALQPKWNAKLASNGEWIGPPFSVENRDWQFASAINHLDPDDPPILFLHCKDDSTVPWIQSRDMCAKMKQRGIDSQEKYYETGGHGFSRLGDQPMADMVAFFDKTLRAQD